ncbi:MAG: insulinase family protein, partial [candidate division WOR-3 bacterium]|nr:insulinase family protein [candidate division WOR-3 bacterium]MDW7987849.1 pitrilysin family protein [candidate division WOR-3 bacterium]
MKKTMILCFLLVIFSLTEAKVNFNKPYPTHPIYEATLKNGLKVVIYKDSLTPTVSSQLWFNVGSIYDPPGRSGLSHLLEHMDGTKNYKPRAIAQIIDSLGGEDNAFTSNLYVCYWIDLAQEFYETALALLAERMENLLITEEKFLSERNVVMEERRLGENEPYDILWEQFDLLTFKFHPYRNPVIGWMDDIRRITLNDLINHYKTYYQPQNAILVLSGNVEVEDALKKINRYFAKIKSRPVQHPKFYEPPQVGEQTLVLYRKVSLPAVLIGYRTADSLDNEYYALEVLEGLLGWGKAARLYKKLVEEKNFALRVGVWNDLEREAGVFKIFVVPKKIEYLDTIIILINKELENLMSLGPDSISDFEMTRIRNNIIANEIYSRDRARGIGMRIGRQLIVSGKLVDMIEYPKRVENV